MTMEDRRKYSVSCDICGEPASEIFGGEYQKIHKIWLVCKECKEKIRDARKKQ